MTVFDSPCYAGNKCSHAQDSVVSHQLVCMACVQDNVPPFSSDAAVQLIEEGLQAPISEKFEDFNREPIAAASLGQARLASCTVLVAMSQPAPEPYHPFAAPDKLPPTAGQRASHGSALSKIPASALSQISERVSSRLAPTSSSVADWSSAFRLICSCQQAALSRNIPHL